MRVDGPAGRGDEAVVPVDLDHRGRAVRRLATVAAGGLLLYGTVAGGDDMFPFGPFHMYSRYYPADGAVTSSSVRATTADGRDVLVTQQDIGIARGAIEGQVADFAQKPERLAELARAHTRRHPAAPPYVAVRIVQTRWEMRDRRVVATSHVTLAEWHAP